MSAESYHLRPFLPGESVELLGVWNAGAATAIPLDLLVEKVFDDAGVEADLRVVAEADGRELIGFGVAVARSTRADGGAVKLLAVAPGHRRKGVGTEILDCLTTRLATRGCTSIRVGESPPNYLRPGIDARELAAIGFFEATGYVQFGTVYNMACPVGSINLDRQPDEGRLEQRGIHCKRASNDDRSAVLAFIELHWPLWRSEVVTAFGRSPKAIHIAVSRDESVLGFAAHSTNNEMIGWFGPMGTDPAARGLGVGSVLLKRCLVDLRRRGYRTVTIPWVGPVAFYERTVGATVSETFLRYERVLDPAG